MASRVGFPDLGIVAFESLAPILVPGHTVGFQGLNRVTFTDDAMSPAVAPVISSASPFRLSGTLTLQFSNPIAVPISLTANGVALASITKTGPSTITAAIDSGGYGAIGSSIPLVFRDTAGTSAAFNVTVATPAGTQAVTFTSVPLWASGVVVGDQAIFVYPTEFNGQNYNAQIQADGAVNFGGNVPDIPLVYRLLDASDNYRAGGWGTLYAPSDPALDPSVSFSCQMGVYDGFNTNLLNRVIVNLGWQNFTPYFVQSQRLINGVWANMGGIANPAGNSRSLSYSTNSFTDGQSETFRMSAQLFPAVALEYLYSDPITIQINNAPVVTIPDILGTQIAEFAIDVNFSKPVTGLLVSHFQVATASAGAVQLISVTEVSGSNGAAYRLRVVPQPGTNETAVISIRQDANVVDAVGNWLHPTLGKKSVSVQINTPVVATDPRILSIGDDNIVLPGETVTLSVDEINLAQMSQLVLAGNTGEYVIPFNGTATVTIPNFVPTGTYTLKLRRFN